MKKIVFTSCCFILSILKLCSQTDTLHINGIKFYTVIKAVLNEFHDKDNKDTVILFYRIKDGQAKYLLKHYKYKYSVDCNNQYWDIGSYKIQNDSLLFITEYKQEGKDPIPEKRKQIFKVQADGKLIEVYDKQLRNDEWEDVLDNKN